MKLVYVCFAAFCVMIALPGCGGEEGSNEVITEGLTADDYAKYEADLAAANAEGSYDDDEIDNE